jgi:hypothetical protein
LCLTSKECDTEGRSGGHSASDTPQTLLEIIEIIIFYICCAQNLQELSANITQSHRIQSIYTVHAVQTHKTEISCTLSQVCAWRIHTVIHQASNQITKTPCLRLSPTPLKVFWKNLEHYSYNFISSTYK